MKTTMGQLLYNFGTTFRQLLNNFETAFEQLWDNIVTSLGQIWFNFLDNLEKSLVWDNFDTTVGQFWQNFKRAFGQLLDNMVSNQRLLAELTFALWATYGNFYSCIQSTRPSHQTDGMVANLVEKCFPPCQRLISWSKKYLAVELVVLVFQFLPRTWTRGYFHLVIQKKTICEARNCVVIKGRYQYFTIINCPLCACLNLLWYISFELQDMTRMSWWDSSWGANC